VKKKSPPYALIGALVLGIGAVYFFHQYTVTAEKKAQDAAAAARAEMQGKLDAANAAKVTVTEAPTDVRAVLYATQPVEPGVRISPAFFEKKLTPKSILPDAYTDQSDIVGWYATRKIEKGDPLTPRNIGKSLPFMSERISPGMRAVALKVFTGGDVNNTGGFIVDGDKVDLLYTTGMATEMVMQNVNVLYVPGPPVKTEKTDGVVPVGDVSVTFEVTPEQAQALIYMSGSKGRFSMILRSRKDNSEIKIKPFAGADYVENFKKVQSTTDKSIERVQQLAAEIEAKEKTQDAQGKTNETTTPTSPSP
jgi:Flp pilus assembly protein CpaB